MKKYFLSLVAMAAAMLFATSCQESLVEPQIEGPTTFTVQLPDAMGTKAIGDKENVNQLLVAVYSEATGGAVALTRATATSTSGQFKVQFNLLQDQSYDIVFWAQVEDKYVSSTGDFDLKSIPMTNIYHNNENGAAFFAYVANFVPTGSAQSVTLKRPFAQLNLGTTGESLNPATGAVSLVSSEIKIKGLAQQFNTISGMGENPTTEVVTYYATIPENWQKLSAANHEYVYVSMDYLPIVGDAKAVFDIEAKIVVKDAAGEKEPINHKFTSVPVQENYRTNIVGNLISSTSDFIVSIDDRFEEDYSNTDDIISNDYLVVDNVYEAQVAFGKGETHVAINNIGNTQTLQLPDNGKELYLQLPDSDGQITIKRDAGNFNISVPDTNPLNTGLTIKIVAPNSTVDVTGQANVIYSTTASNTLNLNGAKVGKIIVEKGNVVIENVSQVEEIAPGQGVDARTITIYVDDSSEVGEESENHNFKIIEEPEIINTLEALQNALTYSTSDVIVLDNGIVNTSEFTLKLNGKTVTAVDNSTGSYGLITNKANLTIEGPGTISLTATNNRGWNAYSSVISNTVGGNLTVGEGVVIEHLGGTDMAYGIDNLTNGKNTSAIATINDATVKSTYRAVRQFLNGVEANNSLTVNSGAVIEGANKSIWMQDPSVNSNTGTLVVNEGATLNGDVYLYVCAGSTEWPVSVSIAASTVIGEVLTGNVPAGYGVILEEGIWKVEKNSDKYVFIGSAEQLIMASEQSFKGGQKVFLTNDIDLKDKEFTGLSAFNPENNNTFDGQGYTVSNWSYDGVASDMGFIKNWVGPIKNVKFENCHLKTAGRSAVVAAKVYGNIDNVIVENSTIEDSYWACGIIAGLYNNGSVSNCIVRNSSVKSNGGTAAIVGVFNESAGERKLINCSVEGTTINNTGIYGESYSGGALVGIFNCAATFIIENCTVKENILEGNYIFEKYPADETVTIIER